METKVLTPEEVQSLKTVREKRIQLSEDFGIIELQLQEISLQKDYLKTVLNKLREEEKQIGETLQQKYGNGQIDLEKGEFKSN